MLSRKCPTQRIEDCRRANKRNGRKQHPAGQAYLNTSIYMLFTKLHERTHEGPHAPSNTFTAPISAHLAEEEPKRP